VTECCIPAGHPPAAVEIARNKLLTRERLRDTDLLVPWFFPTSLLVDPAALAGMVEFPCMIKPLIPTGGRGVARVDDAASFVRAIGDLRTLLSAVEFSSETDEDRSTALVEGYIDGWEFALQGLLMHGALNVEKLFDTDDPQSMVPEPIRRDILDAVSRAIAAIGLHHGAVHARCRLGDRGVYVMSVTP
jgi:biotin carboxylase